VAFTIRIWTSSVNPLGSTTLGARAMPGLTGASPVRVTILGRPPRVQADAAPRRVRRTAPQRDELASRRSDRPARVRSARAPRCPRRASDPLRAGRE
jgi:hypothetical protein